MRLCDRISGDRLWPALEQAAIQIAAAGGMAAMGFYRDAWKARRAFNDGKNPSTDADIQATAAILQSCHTLLAPIADRLPCALSYLGEESCYQDRLRELLSHDALRRVHEPERFFGNSETTLRVIFDGIDGTGNFNRGLPLFCSAAAILIEDQVRVSGIYDPIHHVVYSASLPGPYEKPDLGATASAWQVSAGARIDMIAEARAQAPKPLREEAVGIHLTRSHKAKLREFPRPGLGQEQGMLERLAEASAGVYALNSGIVAMTEVARGGLGGFVNIVTNPWDTAAGECLVRACGGAVTTADGRPIRDSSPEKISVVAAKSHLHGPILQALGAVSESIP